MDTRKIYLLSKVDLLSELSNTELTELEEAFKWEDYVKGSDIIRQGQEHHLFYVLTDGQTEALVDKSGLPPMTVSSFVPGDAFGEVSLFTGKPAPYTVRCLTDCRVLAMDAENFAWMLLRWPKLYQSFIEKISHLLNQVNTGLWETKHKEILRAGLRQNQMQYKFYGLWGSAKTTAEIEARIEQLAKTRESLLIIGERGTGRQMLAWYIHKQQYGEAAPFIVVDGRHFDQHWADLMFDPHHNEPYLAFKSSGLLDLAEGGTLFIREINLISPKTQIKLANVLLSQDLGCRIMASIKGDPTELAQPPITLLLEKFTQSYKIRPLRERKKDIPVIAHGILEKLALQHERKPPVIEKEAMKLLLTHHYRQGNVTELIQVIERSFFLAEEDSIGLEHLFFGPTAEKIGRSINLLSWEWIDTLIKKGNFLHWFQRIFTVIFLFITLFLLLTPNVRMTGVLFLLVWGLWWPVLTVCSTFFGRVWCGVCPISGVMEQVQKYLHWNRPVPDFLKKYDYLIVTFLFVFVFWIEAVTEMRFYPVYTALWLIIIMLAAIVVGIIFTRHTWCRHLCPLGGFVGMASIGGMLEVRSDPEVCLNKCTTYECYRGNGQVPGCPMSLHVPFVDSNLSCKLCLRCVRNCPNGSVKLNLRIPAREVWHLVRVNQGFAIFVGVSLAILIPINYFEPLHQVWPLDQWRLWYSLAYWATALAAGVLTWFIAQPFRTKAASRRVKLVFAFIPMILAGYIAYQIHFLPGANSIMVGFGLQESGKTSEAFYFPALRIGQALAFIVGLFLTGFTIIMVLVRTKKRTDGKSTRK